VKPKRGGHCAAQQLSLEILFISWEIREEPRLVFNSFKRDGDLKKAGFASQPE
jgi:hypothetical protein